MIGKNIAYHLLNINGIAVFRIGCSGKISIKFKNNYISKINYTKQKPD